MDPERERIKDDLGGLVAGDILVDDVSVQLYASDASLYEIVPLGVIQPKTTADVSAVLRYANEQRIPVHARGAGTGLAGESLGRGLVLDFSRHMRRLVNNDHDTVRVQPGLVHGNLNDYLRRFGRTFGPDPAMSAVTTMGSVVSVDSSGSLYMRYGSARRHVRSLQVVMADGEILELGREPIEQAYDEATPERRRELILQTAELLTRRAAVIDQNHPRGTINRSGYQLWDVLDAGHIDFPKLLAGSEGTLGLITEMTLETQVLPRYRGMALLFFSRLDSAAAAIQEVLNFQPWACDLLDRRHLSLARETDARYEALIPAESEAVLIVEYSGDDAVDVRAQIGKVIDRVRRKRHLAFDARQAFDPSETDFYWQLARRVVPTLQRLKGNTRAWPFVEDMAVPPAKIGDFLVRMQNTLKKHQVTASLYAHAGHGQLHVRPFMDLAEPGQVAKLDDLASDLYEQVFQVGGSISGEHGDGLSRTPFMRQQYGPLCEVFREVKQIFDPVGILNPGKIVADRLHLVGDNLRPIHFVPDGDTPHAPELGEPTAAPESVAEGSGDGETEKPPLETFELQLNWTLPELTRVARRCNGCGSCRTQSEEVRMCPIFRASPREEASPRAKANLMLGVLSERLDVKALTRDEAKNVADLCVGCHQCRLECPAEVDIPRLMMEAKAQHVVENGQKPSDWLLCRFDLLSRWGSYFSPVANWMVSNRMARWLLQKTLGIAYSRKLPRFTGRSFMRRAARRRLTRPSRRSGRKVLYVVDTYANYHDPQLAEALVMVLEHNGVAVYVHPSLKPTGMALATAGAIEATRDAAKYNVPRLAEAVRQGYTIVATEPSTVLALTEVYPQVLDDAEAKLVAANTVEACSYLWGLHRQGSLQLDLRPINAVLAYHLPCHSRALNVGAPAESLLRLIPALSVHRFEKGCSGMAGIYGLKRENFRNSLRAGWDLISALRDPAIQIGSTECSACKMQMEQGNNKPTVHPVKLLALAYGLMPEINRLLSLRSDDLVVT